MAQRGFEYKEVRLSASAGAVKTSVIKFVGYGDIRITVGMDYGTSGSYKVKGTLDDVYTGNPTDASIITTSKWFTLTDFNGKTEDVLSNIYFPLQAIYASISASTSASAIGEYVLKTLKTVGV